MKRIYRWLIGMSLAGALGLGGWLAYSKGITAQSATTTTPSTVQVVKLATSSIQSTVLASGNVRSNQNATVSWQVSGKVGAVNVKVGDQVQANEILATLDESSLTATILSSDQSLSSTILTAKEDLPVAEAALSALTDSQTALYQDQKAVIDAQTAVNHAQSHRAMMNSETRGTDQQIADALASYLMAQDNVNRARQYYESLPGDPVTELHNKAPALLNLEKAITQRDTALKTLNWYKGKWTAAEIADADKSLAVAKANLADAQAALEALQNGGNTSAIAAAQLRVTNDEATIDKQNVRAPISGTITSVSIQVGDTVSAGTIAFRMDDMTSYYVDLGLSEVDVSKVKVGQAATITFDAIQGTTYHGVVTAVGSAGTTTNGVVNFPVTIQITDPDKTIRLGMTATAEIVVSSTQNALVVPSSAIRTIGNQAVVYLLSGVSAGSSSGQSPAVNTTAVAGNKPALTPVKVEVGMTSGTLVQITSNQLKVGDLVVANPTSAVIASLTAKAA